MSELPIVNSKASPQKLKRITLHIWRIAVFVLILVLIRAAHKKNRTAASDLAKTQTTEARIVQSLPEGQELGPFDDSVGSNLILDENENTIGYAIQTFPECESIIGYSGATNCLILLDSSKRITSVEIVFSGDTFDHVEVVKHDPDFLKSFNGINATASVDWQEIDGATGATLTSYAVIASVAKRLSGTEPVLKFNPQPKLENVQKLFGEANELRASDQDSVWLVTDATGQTIGRVITSTPVTDDLPVDEEAIRPYQGPTAFLIALDPNGQVTGIVVDQTFENEPYAFYLDDDYGFQGIYQSKTIEELAVMIPEELGIEGVSGATMTSMHVARGIPLVASNYLNPPDTNSNQDSRQFLRSFWSYWPDIFTITLTIIGVLFSFTTLSRYRLVRVAYQIAVVIFLGFINAHLVSQALVVGWAENSVPWKGAPGLVFLSLAALAIPIFSKHQPYCQHICPFGAIQQLAKNRMGWKVKLSSRVRKLLGLIPYALLGLVIVVAIGNFSLNLASIEPFDAFSIRVAGWVTIAVFVLGLLFSLVSPMAYCRYGCPTGAALNFLKFRADSHRFGIRDIAALSLVGFAVLVSFVA